MMTIVEAHRVTSLPGLLGEYPHDMYAGHIPIHEPILVSLLTSMLYSLTLINDKELTGL
jgi:hypothetical protein